MASIWAVRFGQTIAGRWLRLRSTASRAFHIGFSVKRWSNPGPNPPAVPRFTMSARPERPSSVSSSRRPSPSCDSVLTRSPCASATGSRQRRSMS
eukprot:2737860-Prymnesium_polylepis.1